MILFEFEGKALLQEAGITVPNSQLITSPDEQINIELPVVLKAQVLSGKRAQSGGIIIVETSDQLEHRLKALFSSEINGEQVDKILVEQKLEFENEYYLSIAYDTNTRGPVLTISTEGGTGIEDRQVKVVPIDPLNPIANLPNTFGDTLSKLVQLFFDQDMTLLEINPIVQTSIGWTALDAKVKLDDDAKFRHPDWQYPPRGVAGHKPTQAEIDAKKIDQDDYRGTAGSAYFDIDGDIAVLSSGGGISLTAMDALINCGGRPANFTEYSGNPPKEKVSKLVKIVLSKPNLHGLWVVGTVAANFTDIYETLSGLIEGLRDAKTSGTPIDFPIVIRRGGPRDQEAFEMLRNVKDFDLHLYGGEVSVAQSAKIMADLAKQYAAVTN
jgi:succinyl-CoA synthetase beta subunit